MSSRWHDVLVGLIFITLSIRGLVSLHHDVQNAIPRRTAEWAAPIVIALLATALIWALCETGQGMGQLEAMKETAELRRCLGCR